MVYTRFIFVLQMDKSTKFQNPSPKFHVSNYGPVTNLNSQIINQKSQILNLWQLPRHSLLKPYSLAKVKQ